RRSRARLLGDWRDVFEQFHDQQRLDREVAQRRATARGRRPEQVVAEAMECYDFVYETGIDSVLLIPSRVIWPALHVFDHLSTNVVCYPIRAGRVVDPTKPPKELLAFGQALGWNASCGANIGAMAKRRPSIYEFAGGAEAFLALAAATHERCLQDPELNHPFSHTSDPNHLEHLAAYWAEALGGPARYSESL